MLLTLDLDSEVPIYQQIRDRIVEAVADGVLAEGSALPSTRQLGADLGINFHTVNKAYDLLRTQGFIRINRKTGAVVRRDASSGPAEDGYADEWQERLRTLLAEAVALGLGPREVTSRCESVLDSFAVSARR
ncbi:GntR family transcriptional regulator [Amycolatopsis roodepoortensis]|uniref:GntR family transcriptional regulator n=1 Tax=Amycolatopsis TaxID=1813 RepID=UPI000F87065E|nr:MULTISPECIES: GntR family transcriptional regulator [Amycolatopsis]QXV56829.1 GntR family transcriptional regulator [Amycolatopsis sp. TNS106]RSN13583.1 GntR family transcriptional regulator [Streptomyces sp. WAC 05977]UUV31838.1 GntR family transcriptional regulator [Amycolatopsis roodepoortensis]